MSYYVLAGMNFKNFYAMKNNEAYMISVLDAFDVIKTKIPHVVRCEVDRVLLDCKDDAPIIGLSLRDGSSVTAHSVARLLELQDMFVDDGELIGDFFGVSVVISNIH